MIAEYEIPILQLIHDLAHILGGELLHGSGGHEPRQGLRHDDAVCAHGLHGLDVFQQELGAFFQNRVDELRLLVGQEQDLVHVHQAARHGEGAGAVGEDGAVGHQGQALAQGPEDLPRSPRAQLGDLQGVSFLLGGDELPGDGGDIVGMIGALGAEGFRFHGQVHIGGGEGHVVPVRDQTDPQGHFAGGIDQLVHRDEQLLHGGIGQKRHGFFVLRCDLLADPEVHVHSRNLLVKNRMIFFEFSITDTGENTTANPKRVIKDGVSAAFPPGGDPDAASY